MGSKGEFDLVGAEQLADAVLSMAESIDRMTPVKFNEENRYLPQGVSPRPGFIRYDLFPYLTEIIECFDPLSPVRECNLMKGVQTGYTTALESIILYYIGHIQTQPLMYLTADKELASARIENNIIPMINESGFADHIRSADENNTRKTGKTKDYIQWDGGGFMIYNGAVNATKMRQFSAPLLLKDELDGWKRNVGKDGNSDSLTDARASAYWAVRKILRGSTPLLKPSLIDEAYRRGDRRKYMILCKRCSYPQYLRMEHTNKDTGLVGGFQWETEKGSLVLDSVRYVCINCGQEHVEYDKEKLFSAEHGAHWEPTAEPAEPGIRSYHLPAFYSPVGFTPWSKCISDYLDAYSPEDKQTKSVSKLQTFYNNILGEPFRVQGGKISYKAVSSHSLAVYRFGEIPNTFAREYSGSRILLLTCQIDVHKSNLAVAVFGWTAGLRSYLIDYWRFEDENCADIDSPVWDRVRELIEEKEYVADDGYRYKIQTTLIDASWETDTITTFCAEYAAGVYPIMGRDRPSKTQTIMEYGEFTTKNGLTGYKITVDHYKDRLSTVLRRQWYEEDGEQKRYHWNAPTDITTKQITELTVETKEEKVDPRTGATSHVWHRPSGAKNELWDLSNYGHACVEIIAHKLFIEQFGQDAVDWDEFWRYIEDQALYFTPPKDS